MIVVKRFAEFDRLEEECVKKASDKLNEYIEFNSISREDIMDCRTEIKQGGISMMVEITLTYWKN